MAHLPESRFGVDGGRANLCAQLFLVCLILVVFGQIVSHDFVLWDDNIHIYENRHIWPLNSSNLLYFFTHPYEGLYVPLSYLLFMTIASAAHTSFLNETLTDTHASFNPHVFHTVSLLIHIVNTLLAFNLISRLLLQLISLASVSRKKIAVASAIGAALFAVHPLQVESVAWIAELRGLLAGLLGLCALLIYLPAEGQTERKPAKVALASLLGVAAMLAKPSVVTLPLIACIIDATIYQSAWKVALLRALPWTIAAAGIVPMTRGVQEVPASLVTPLWIRPFIAADALDFYIGKLFLPWPLTIDYGRTPLSVMANTYHFIAPLLPICVFAALPLMRKKLPILMLASTITFLVLLPVLGFVPFVYQAFSTVADRYMYLAMIGPALALAWGLANAKTNAGVVAASVLIAVFAGLSFAQTRVWQSSLTLFAHAIEVNPKSPVAQSNYAQVLQAHGRLQEAIVHDQAALALNPSNYRTLNNLATIYISLGDFAEARTYASRAVAVQPNFADGYVNLGNSLGRLGQPTQAIKEYQTALRYDPVNADALNNLGNAYVDVKMYSQAQQLFASAIASNPDKPGPYVGLGNVLFKTGQPAQAEGYYQHALALDPNIAEAHMGLGICLATQGQLDDAISELQRAAELDPNNQTVQGDLRLALSMKGQTGR